MEDSSDKVFVDDQQQVTANIDSQLLNAASKDSIATNSGLKQNEKSKQDHTMTQEINQFLRDMPLTDDNTCGFWLFKGKFFQKFANQTSYAIIYGLVGCISAMTYSYSNATITTIEKRFKIPSRNIGIITVGYYISQVTVSGALCYYADKGHRPRWIGFGLLTLVTYCFLTAAPHFLYGPGEDALVHAIEFGAMPDENATLKVMEEQRSRTLCRLRSDAECEVSEGNIAAQVIFFVALFIAGIGRSLYYTLGISYMDDNINKSKTPALLSFTYFLRMLGPTIGHALASICLRVYIAPQLQPVIKIEDPRWLGAWWMGWLIIGSMIMASGILLTMFPKELPRSAARRMINEDQRTLRHPMKIKNIERSLKIIEQVDDEPSAEEKASFNDMVRTFRRLSTNKTMMYNNLAAVFYYFGYSPYWMFISKYIEVQFRQSAAASSMVIGSVALVFSIIGLLLSGVVISKYKPSARNMAAWNVVVLFLTVAGIITYAFIGCPLNEQSVVVNIFDKVYNNSPTCNSACSCDYVPYSPVCGENNKTYISPCHAGCKQQYITNTGTKLFYDCSCIPHVNFSLHDHPPFEKFTPMDLIKGDAFWNISSSTPSELSSVTSAGPDPLLVGGGQAVAGACPVNCFAQFVTFLAVMCAIKFVGATARTSNFLLFVRCVPVKDKTAAMAFSMIMVVLMAFIPSPIFFGWLLDRLCLVWGKTCTNKGNCWLYDAESLRYTLNITAATFMLIGGIFDVGVWYHVKDLKIFDDENVEQEIVKKDEEEMRTEI